MSTSYFASIDKIRYEGPESDNPLAFRWYDADRVVGGKPMRDWLRFSVCYWHTFCWNGFDVFGAGTFDRPWHRPGDPMAMAELKMQAAFEFFEKLGVPFYTFHDVDVAPEGATFQESCDNLSRLAEKLAEHMARTGVRLLWGTANLFSHPRYAAGAATNPNPEVFARAAAQVKHCMDVTHQLGGENYVLWGGREGYDTLLNTDLKREAAQFGRFLTLVAEYKHKIGFKGTLLIEPKPCEPTKHQYDFDVSTVYGFLEQFGLEKEYKVNIEANHATLAGHSFQHEVATAIAKGIFGSIDANRGDPQNGWDTDQFPNDVAESTLVLYEILRGGGFTTGGFNFDAKVRRQSVDPEDLFHGHIGGMDTLARALLNAHKMLEDGALQRFVDQRYAGWSGPLGRDILDGKLGLADLFERVRRDNLDPKHVSGKQEYLENLVNRYL
ncbi:MAG: xylose isomerase [Gammaproteobacteria bacterium]|nr:MAG: xylose isomerase [Gammaproteobacteria bacterium]